MAHTHKRSCNKSDTSYIQLRFASFIVSKCGSSESIRAWFVMAVAAMMQSPIGMFLYWHLSSPACLAIVGFRLCICRPVSISAR